ncbi:MAG TPA: iron uptake porin [Kamptonema sp.]|nr:iron uptake porin [Kamptonema sp.]
MSKFLWRSLLISPAVLGATLVVSASAMAAKSQPNAEALKLGAAQTEASKIQVEVQAAAEQTPATNQVVAVSNFSEVTTEPAIAQEQVETATPDAIAANPAPAVPATSVTEPASTLQLEAPAANEQVSLAPLQSPAPIAVDQTQLALPKSAEVVAQTAAPATSNPASTLEQLNQYSSEGSANSEAQGQVTSVSQLSDVQPTDWAFQALQSLVERYGCIAGYPDGTYRGNRAMTRYEFAAGLNACLERVNELIGAGTANLVSREDLAALQRLQEEFAAELATLRGRVDALEARTAELEANQFSTTTKLTGEAIFALSDDFGGGFGIGNFGRDLGSDNNQAVFQQRVRLNLNTSFTGRDLLLTRLQVGNGDNFNFGATSEGTQTWQAVGNTGNTFVLDSLLYKFPATSRLNVTIAANAGTWDDIIPTVNPYFEDFEGGNGALTSFAQRNPIYRLGGGAGIGFDYAFGGRGLLGGIFGPTSLSFGYLAANAASPAESKGLFNGDYAAMAQLTFTPTRNLQFALSYNHGYFDRGNFGFDNGLVNGTDALGGFTGTGVANSINGLTEGFSNGARAKRVSSNSYGLEASLRLNRRFVLGGWVGYTAARVIGIGDARIWNYAVTLAFPDLGKEGNLGGIVLGREPYLAQLEARDGLDKGFQNDASWHIEGFYKFQLTDNISVTPGVVWITNPNQNDSNDDIIIGTLRTTFTF